ncbi:MAG: hypothetical protein RJA19_1020 [Bacteroidota bacterium]|jgi:FkbM family methyltransferase
MNKAIRRKIREWLYRRGFTIVPNPMAQFLGWEKTRRQREAHDVISGERHQPFYSQLGQDYLASALFGGSGYFVEFGACDGLKHSNTKALEELGWKGILAEPDKSWHEALEQNRPGAIISTQCVWKESGATLNFSSATIGVLSTLSEFQTSDFHLRKIRESYPVETISLLDLLREQGAPDYIHYLSIDTEGSEFDILASFDFDAYRFGLITVEHNFTDMREKLHTLLTGHGYVRALEVHSRWDDWYFDPALIERHGIEPLSALL